ncbi:MAG: hypothetical protein ACFFG0_12770 [Candidatus Thorarchaeota archaeon]
MSDFEDQVIKTLSKDEWQSFSTLAKKLGVKLRLDLRYLERTLKALRNNGFVLKDYINGEKAYILSGGEEERVRKLHEITKKKIILQIKDIKCLAWHPTELVLAILKEEPDQKYKIEIFEIEDNTIIKKSDFLVKSEFKLLRDIGLVDIRLHEQNPWLLIIHNKGAMICDYKEQKTIYSSTNVAEETFHIVRGGFFPNNPLVWLIHRQYGDNEIPAYWEIWNYQSNEQEIYHLNSGYNVLDAVLHPSGEIMGAVWSTGDSNGYGIHTSKPELDLLCSYLNLKHKEKLRYLNEISHTKSGGMNGSPTFSPEGRLFAFFTENYGYDPRSKICIESLETGDNLIDFDIDEKVYLDYDTSKYKWSLQFINSGTQVAFYVNDTIYIYDLSGKLVRKEKIPYPGLHYSPSFKAHLYYNYLAITTSKKLFIFIEQFEINNIKRKIEKTKKSLKRYTELILKRPSRFVRDLYNPDSEDEFDDSDDFCLDQAFHLCLKCYKNKEYSRISENFRIIVKQRPIEDAFQRASLELPKLADLPELEWFYEMDPKKS